MTTEMDGVGLLYIVCVCTWTGLGVWEGNTAVSVETEAETY